MPDALDVVITGIGVVSPLGVGRQAYAAALAAGQSGIGPLTRFDASALAAPFGGEVRDFDPKAHIRPLKSLKVMCRDIQLGVAAAALALEDSGLPLASVDPERRGVVMGAELMPCEPAEVAGAFHACVDDGRFDFAAWGTRALGEMYPLWMLKYLPNMPACHVAIAHDCRGPNNTVALWEVSSLLAITEAVSVIRRGQADVMLAGGACSRLNPTQAVRNNVWPMSRRAQEPTAASRPFERDRDGQVVGEGSAVFVLETRANAEARRATIWASVAGWASTFGKPAPYDFEHRDAIVHGIMLALERAGISPDELGHVNAHGLSTIDQDRIEAGALWCTLADVPVTAPKSYFGNLGAASGAVELVASLLALTDDRIPPTLNYEVPDPTCPVQVVAGAPRAGRPRSALALNQNPTGQAVALALRGA